MSAWYKSLTGYNPTSGSYIYNQGGKQMLDAPWLSKPMEFGGTNYASDPRQQRGNNAPTPRIQETMRQQGITITPAGNRKPKNNNNQISITGGTGPTQPAQQAAPAPAPAQPAQQPRNVQAQIDRERERLELQRQQREEQARRLSEQMDADYRRGLQNQLDTLVYATEKAVKEYGDKVSDDEKKAIAEAVEKAKKALESESVDEIKKAQEELQKSSHKLSEEVYKAAQAQQQAGAQAGPGGPGPEAQGEEKKNEEDVVDADFKVDDDKKKE